MTEPKTETPPADSQAAAENKPASGNKAAAANKSASSPARPAHTSSAAKVRRSPVLGIAFVVVLLIAAALATGLWYQQKAFRQAHSLLMGQVQSSSSAASQAGSQAQQALTMAQEQGARIDALQSSLSASQAQVAELDQAFQLLTDKGSDLVLLNDVDHLVQIANQQLTLSGNAGNAIIALETAQAQLARANRPGLASLQQAINGDLDRLRAVSTIDIAQLSARLDELGALVGSAPLLIPDAAAPNVDTTERDAALSERDSAATEAVDPNAPWWRRSLDDMGRWAGQAWAVVRHDLGGLVSVRRVQDSSALLLSPDQAGKLRENLRLRVMTAQLALMMRQPAVWDSEMQVLVKALDTQYDVKAPDTQHARKLAAQLADTSIALKLPGVGNSMQALEALREANIKAADQANSPSSLDESNGANQPGQPPEALGGVESAPSQPEPGQNSTGQPALLQE